MYIEGLLLVLLLLLLLLLLLVVTGPLIAWSNLVQDTKTLLLYRHLKTG